MEAYFRTRFKYHPKKEEIWKVLCKYFQKFIPPDSRILDFGAGYCYFINNITAKEKYAVDIDKVVLEYANDEVITYVGNLQELKFEDNYFDVVFSSNTLEHMTIEEILQTLREINRILKKDGTFIILSPNFRYSYKVYFDDYTHKSILTDKSLRDMLLSCGFEIKKIFPKFLPFSTESKLPKNTWLIRIYLMSPWKPFAGQMLVIARKTGVILQCKQS